MLKAHKALTAIFTSIMIIGAVALELPDLFAGNYIEGIFKALGWVIAVGLIFAIALTIADNRKIKLLLDCKPSDYIAYAQQIYPEIKNKQFKNSYRINLFVAFSDLGEIDKAREYLSEFDDLPLSNMNAVLSKHAYYINQSVYYQMKGDLDCAESEFEKAKELLEANNVSPQAKDQLLKINMSHRFSLNIANGVFDGAEEFFTEYFNTQTTPRGKVVAKLNLAEIYVRSGDKDKAIEACDYVISNGGKTHFVNEAKAFLTMI